MALERSIDYRSTSPAQSFPELPGQRGLATRIQLRQEGFSRSAISHALTTRWSEVLPRVVVPHRGPVTPEQRVAAAALWAGSQSVLTGSEALKLFGLPVKAGSPTITLLVPATHRERRAAFAQTRRTHRMAAVAHRKGCIPLASPARALADRARLEEVPPDELEAETIAALQRRTTTPELLARELAGSRRNHLGPVARGLASFTAGAWSRPEVVLQDLTAELPELDGITFNPELFGPDDTFVGCPDAYVERLGLAIQVHSRQFHTGTDEDGRDLLSETFLKDGRLTAVGITVVPVTPTTLSRRPHVFLRDLLSTADACLGRPLPPVRVDRRGGAAPRA